MTKTRLLVLSVLVLLCVAVGFLFFAEYRELSNRGDIGTPEPVALQEEEVPAEEEVPEPVMHLTGMIEEISGSSFTLAVISVGGEEVDASLKERTVTVSDDTTITVITVPDPEDVKRKMETFEAEMEKYTEAVKKFQEENGVEAKLPEDLVPPPLPVISEREEGTISALEVGQTVSVLTEKDVRTEENFTAVSIEVVPKPPKPLDVTGQIKSVPVTEQANQ